MLEKRALVDTSTTFTRHENENENESEVENGVFSIVFGTIYTDGTLPLDIAPLRYCYPACRYPENPKWYSSKQPLCPWGRPELEHS